MNTETLDLASMYSEHVQINTHIPRITILLRDSKFILFYNYQIINFSKKAHGYRKSV